VTVPHRAYVFHLAGCRWLRSNAGNTEAPVGHWTTFAQRLAYSANFCALLRLVLHNLVGLRVEIW
jgi:hypothetical protein